MLAYKTLIQWKCIITYTAPFTRGFHPALGNAVRGGWLFLVGRNVGGVSKTAYLNTTLNPRIWRISLRELIYTDKTPPGVDATVKRNQGLRTVLLPSEGVVVMWNWPLRLWRVFNAQELNNMARRGFRQHRKGIALRYWSAGRSAYVLLANIGPQIVRVCYNV